MSRRISERGFGLPPEVATISLHKSTKKGKKKKKKRTRNEVTVECVLSVNRPAETEEKHSSYFGKFYADYFRVDSRLKKLNI